MIRCPLPLDHPDRCDRGSLGCGKVYRHNLRMYWRQHLVHVGLGALSGALMVSGTASLPIAGLGLLLALCVYQGLEFAKRHDTPGIDLAYIVGGLVAGMLPRLWLLYA